MGTVIEAFRVEHEAAVRDFNRRLRAGGEREFEFPESAVPDWLPPTPGRTIYQQYFVAVDGKFLMDDVPGEECRTLRRLLEAYRKENAKPATAPARKD